MLINFPQERVKLNEDDKTLALSTRCFSVCFNDTLLPHLHSPIHYSLTVSRVPDVSHMHTSPGVSHLGSNFVPAHQQCAPLCFCSCLAVVQRWLVFAGTPLQGPLDFTGHCCSSLRVLCSSSGGLARESRWHESLQMSS